MATAIAARLEAPPASAEPASGVAEPGWWWEPINQKQAAGFLQVSSSTISALGRRGQLPVTYALGRNTPRYDRAQLIAWQPGLPIPLPPWSGTTPIDWLWFPLSPEEAARFLRSQQADVETRERKRDLPFVAFPSVRHYFWTQLLTWLLGQPIPQAPRWDE
jgi:hypothetical protein